MKRFVIFTVVLCLILGLAACTKPPAKNPTTPTTTPTEAKPFAGKTLQVYGIGNAESYTNYDNFGKGNYLWMMRAAMHEWATINGVTIEYAGGYNLDSVKPDTDFEKPDIYFVTNNFLAVANYEIVAPWTEAEYNTLAELTGDRRYLDMMNYRTQSYGIVLPWVGNTMLYFNKSMFARYNVKSPLDYWNEGNWTWDTFEICLKEMTRDLNGDGTSDIYGINNNSWSHLVNPVRINEKGELENNIDDPWIRDLIALKYDSYAVDFTTTISGDKILTNVESPMWAMQLSDCLVYDPEMLFGVLSNGDQIMAVPAPQWTGENGDSRQWLKWTQSGVHLTASCDQREAAFDLICYVLKCGMKYMSDMSQGVIKCDYQGIQGISELSFMWKKAFANVLAERKTFISNLPHYDAAHITKAADYLTQMNSWYTYANFGGVPSPINYALITEMPPQESITIIKANYQAAIDKYNELYVLSKYGK